MANYGALPYQGGFGPNPAASSNWYRDDAVDPYQPESAPYPSGPVGLGSNQAPAPAPAPAAIPPPAALNQLQTVASASQSLF